MVEIRHLSILGGRPVSVTKPDLSLLDGIVAPRVLNAMRIASATLTKLGVRHTLVGGLAVGAHGYPRATKDVDFLVGDEAFERHEGDLITMKPGMPIQVGGVVVDFLSIGSDERHLEASLERDVADASTLVYLKLKSPRARDRADVIEMVKAGLDVENVRDYLAANQPAFIEKFEEIVGAARAEE